MLTEEETRKRKRERSRLYYAANREKISERRRLKREVARLKIVDREYNHAIRKQVARKDKCLTRKEMEMLLNYDDRSTPFEMRNTILLHLLAGCGLKIYEATELQTSDINTATGYIIAGRGKKRRDLQMDPRTIPLMVEYLSEYRQRLRPNPQCTTLLISRFKGKIQRDTVYKIARAFGKKLGFELTPEIIRKSFASHYRGSVVLFLKRTGTVVLPPILSGKETKKD